MDVSAWSPSHTILVVVTVVVTAVGVIGQIAVLFYRVRQTEKRLAKSDERSEKRDAELLALIDKRFGEVNHRLSDVRDQLRGEIGEVRTEIGGIREELKGEIGEVRTEMNQGFSDIRGEMNQQIAGVRTEIGEVRTEMNQRLSDMTGEISKLNQNHIDHLNRHNK